MLRFAGILREGLEAIAWPNRPPPMYETLDFAGRRSPA